MPRRTRALNQCPVQALLGMDDEEERRLLMQMGWKPPDLSGDEAHGDVAVVPPEGTPELPRALAHEHDVYQREAEDVAQKEDRQSEERCAGHGGDALLKKKKRRRKRRPLVDGATPASSEPGRSDPCGDEDRRSVDEEDYSEGGSACDVEEDAVSVLEDADAVDLHRCRDRRRKGDHHSVPMPVSTCTNNATMGGSKEFRQMEKSPRVLAKVYVVNKDFEEENDRYYSGATVEMSVRIGEMVRVEQFDSEWWYCCKLDRNGRETSERGWVPEGFLSIPAEYASVNRMKLRSKIRKRAALRTGVRRQ